MCYPKPGPRCSSHAAATYAKAHQKVLAAFDANHKDPDLDKLVAIRKKAEQEYKITPAYFEKLERAIAEEPQRAHWHEDELASAKKERQRRLDAVKGKKPVNHRKAKPEKYVSTKFFNSGDHATKLSYNHPDLTSSIEESTNWSSNLTDEEISTLAWYSEAGFTVVNGHLSATVNPYKDKNISDDHIENSIKIMDSALAKHAPNSEGVIVYRRHHNYNSEGYHEKITPELIAEKFPVGSVYEPGFYLSTSLDPDNLQIKDSANFNLQILTKTGAPLTAISSQGPREYEFITPRTAKFRVVANDVKVTRTGRFNKDEQSTITVIQLEEI